MTEKQLRLQIKSLLKEMARRGRPKKYETVIDPDTGEETKVPISGEVPADDTDLVYDKVSGKWVNRSELETEPTDDEATDLMNQWSPFRGGSAKIDQNSFKRAIEDIVKEMTGTAALAVGPGGDPEDPEGDEHDEDDEIMELRNFIQKTISELDYTNEPETKEVSARTAMKAAASEKLEEKPEEELEEEKNLKEVRKFVNQIIREQEETYEEDSMVPEDPEPASVEPNAPLDMLKELMLADIEEFGRVKSSFEQYWGVIEDVFAEVGEPLSDDVKTTLASEFEYMKENPGEIEGEL